MPTKKKNTTVYLPPETIAALGGYRSSLLNRALECFAHLLSRAQPELGLSAAELKVLAEVVRGRKFDPRSSLIPAELAEAVRAWGGGRTPGQLARKLEAMDYLHAWAAVWAAEASTEEEHS